jgi:hypothetical protein
VVYWKKSNNIDTLYLDVMSPEFEIFGTGVTGGRQGPRESAAVSPESSLEWYSRIGSLEINLVSWILDKHRH